MENIGFIGLGRMGTAMAGRLLESGYSVTVWNRSLDKTQALVAKGAQQADTPAEVSVRADVVIAMLSNDEVAQQIYFAPDGLLSVACTGKLFIDMSTLQPATVAVLAAATQAQDAGFIDAPVSGTVAPAEQGNLLVLCGATERDLKRARPYLAAMSRRIIHAGPVGSGALLKLVVNLPLAVYWSSLAESAALGVSGGLSLELILDTIQDSSAALAVLGLKTPNILGEVGQVAFDVEGMRKDLNSILTTGERQGVSLQTTTAALANYDATSEAGLGAHDAVEIVRYLISRVANQQDIEG